MQNANQKDNKLLSHPKNHVVALFSDRNAAEAAEADLVEAGKVPAEIISLCGYGDADEVQTRALWFADTDEELSHYKRGLESGGVVLAVAVDSDEAADEMARPLKRHNPARMTHFGTLVERVIA